MPFVPAPDTVMAEMRYLWDNQRVENTLYFYLGGGWSTANMATLAAELFTWWNTDLKPQQPTNIQLREIYITDLSSQFSPTYSATYSSGNTGTGGSPSMPNNVSLAVSLRTGARGRSARGRNYFVGLMDVDVTANTVAPARVAAIQSAYSDLVSGVIPTTGTLSVVSRRENNVDRAVALVRPVISATVVDDTVDSMRRRLPKRGQ